MSAARRGATDLSGILVLDKPAGMTSHDVVSIVRKSTGERRIGHAGTLDPSATGVLVVLIGPATRLAPFLTAARKSYDAHIVFGTRTDTDDAAGQNVETQPVPASATDEQFARTTIESLVGIHDQMPPAFSAIKRDGKVAHRAARAGTPIELEARTIEIFAATLMRCDPGPPVSWEIALSVSKGTYVRSIARDLGSALGTVAHLGALRRTASGRAVIADAHQLSVLSSASDVRDVCADPFELLEMPVITVDETTSRLVEVGASIPAPSGDQPYAESSLVAVSYEGRLLAIYRREPYGSTLKAEVVLPGGVAR